MILTFSLLLLAVAAISLMSSEKGWTNLTLARRNAVVFENKNKAYGAYTLRNAYNNHMMIALGVMLLVVMAFVSGNLIWKNLFTDATIAHRVVPTSTATIVDIFDLPSQEIDVPAVKPQTTVVTPPANTEAFTDPVVVDNTTNVAPTQSTLLNATPGVISSTGTGVPGPVEPVAPTGNVSAAPTIWDVADVVPSYPDGYEAMMKYLASNIIYPEMEKDAGVQGTVYITFVVSKSGQIVDVKELKGVRGGPNLSSEAIRVVRKMPRWSPGTVRGEAVNVRFTLPVKFMIR